MKLSNLLYILFSCFLLNTTNTFAQTESEYPQEYFRSPVDGRIYLSGTFGELRSNHFHAGIDIKTGGSEGKNVYAVAEGWVSRVKISPWGYGNAVYIEHPNGYTSVYGHLRELKGAIAEYVKKQQYKQQKFGVDLYLNAHQFMVAKGDIIALSGNSGGSGGPHLHFEIRETSTQEPLNPLLFGIEVKDFITPLIKSLRIFPAEDGTLIQGKNKAENFILKGWGKNYRLKNGDSIQINGDFYLGISTIDKQNDSHNKNGVYQIEVYLDSSLFYSHNVERLNFSNTRYINTLIDYQYYKNGERRYQRTYQSPNNKLAIYNDVINNGVISLNDQKYHLIQYVVSDVKGNSSVLEFTVYSDTAINQITKKIHLPYNPLNENRFENEKISVYFPENSLYDTLTFISNISPKSNHSIVPIFSIGQKDVPLQKRIQIVLKDLFISDSIKNKAYLGGINGKSISYVPAKFENDEVKFKTKNFGDYSIFIDSIAPTIKLKTKMDSKSKPKSLTFIVKDLESGIAQYNAWLNGSWVLLEWDPKKSRMRYQFPNESSSNKANQLQENTFQIIIIDNVGNRTNKTINY